MQMIYGMCVCVCVTVQSDECKWFTLEEMKAALCDTHSLLGPEPIELATAIANMKGLTNVLNVSSARNSILLKTLQGFEGCCMLTDENAL